MELKTNYLEYKEMMDRNGIKKLYHFTDWDNLASIVSNGGLYS